MNMKNEFNNLLQKEMDRLTFLKHVGIGFAAVTGVATVVKSMSSFGGSAQQFGGGSAVAGASNAYGTSAYGGGSA